MRFIKLKHVVLKFADNSHTDEHIEGLDAEDISDIKNNIYTLSKSF